MSDKTLRKARGLNSIAKPQEFKGKAGRGRRRGSDAPSGRLDPPPPDRSPPVPPPSASPEPPRDDRSGSEPIPPQPAPPSEPAYGQASSAAGGAEAAAPHPLQAPAEHSQPAVPIQPASERYPAGQAAPTAVPSDLGPAPDPRYHEAQIAPAVAPGAAPLGPAGSYPAAQTAPTDARPAPDGRYVEAQPGVPGVPTDARPAPDGRYVEAQPGASGVPGVVGSAPDGRYVEGQPAPAGAPDLDHLAGAQAPAVAVPTAEVAPGGQAAHATQGAMVDLRAEQSGPAGHTTNGFGQPAPAAVAQPAASPHRAVTPGLRRKRRELSVPHPVAEAVDRTGINPADLVMAGYRRHSEAIHAGVGGRMVARGRTRLRLSISDEEFELITELGQSRGWNRSETVSVILAMELLGSPAPPPSG